MAIRRGNPGSRAKVTARLLYVVGQLRAGGLERQLCYLLQQLHQRDLPAALLVWSFNENDFYTRQIRELQVPLHGFPTKMGPAHKLKGLRQLVRQIRPEVLHSYSFYTNFAAWLGTLDTTAVAVGSLRSDFITERRLAGPFLGRLSARWPRMMISNNRAAVRAAEHGGFFRPRRAEIVRNGLDLALFKQNPFPTIPTLISVGSLQADKRWERLLTACGDLHRRGKSFRLRMVGDGPLREQLQALAVAKGISKKVEFLGQRDDVPALLAESTFLAHTADREGCPNVVMEAMASGKPVVATDAGDIPDLVEDGRTGFVVRRGDDESLARRMMELIDEPKLCCAMGKAARAKAESEFCLDRLVEGTLRAYRAAGWNG